MNLKKTKLFAENIRKNIIFAAYKAGSKSAHIGGALSIADIFAVLYSDILKINKNKILDENRVKDMPVWLYILHLFKKKLLQKRN